MSDSSNIGNVIGGHKAALKNPNVSKEAKERSKQAIDELGDQVEDTDTTESAGKNTGNVIGGHKATLKNPNVSEEAKEHSRQVLDELEDA